MLEQFSFESDLKYHDFENSELHFYPKPMDHRLAANSDELFGLLV